MVIKRQPTAKPVSPAAGSNASIPALIAPQLATLAAAPPKSGEWSYEIKFDGYRLLARIADGEVRLFTRNGNDWTGKLHSLAVAIGQLGLRDTWIDGEAVVLDAAGLPNFNLLQNAFDRTRTDTILFYAFDLLFLDGLDLRALPLVERRAALRTLLENSTSPRVRFSEAFAADGASVFASACKMGLEGVMAKRLDARYESKRTDTWLKLKCRLQQDFVIGGFTVRDGGEVGAMLLGVYDDEGLLRYAGSVGTGWSAAVGAKLLKQLAAIEASESPFAAKHAAKGNRHSRRAAGSERWVQPTFVVEVAFAEWTPDGSIRHAAYLGLRPDKDAAGVNRERRHETKG